MASAKTYVITVSDGADYSLSLVPDLGEQIHRAIRDFRPGQPKPQIKRRWVGRGTYDVVATVIGASMAEEATCFVVQEHSGAAITREPAEQAHLDAMVNTLRAHGYTCVKRGA